MNKLIRFIRIDIVVQKILFFFVCITGLLLYPLMIMLPILGGWQLLSAVIIRWHLKDKIRMKYLLFCMVYISIMFLSTLLTSYFRSDFYGFIIALIFVPIPFGIAIWYYLQTKYTLEDLEKKRIVEMPETMNDILDSEEMFEKIKNS